MSKAQFTWFAAQISAPTSIASNADALIPLMTAGDSTTVRRCIVDFYLQLLTVTDGSFALGRVGIIALDARTVAAGVTACPLPTTSGDQEWLWNRGFYHRIDVNNTESHLGTLLLHDDVRGMRKLKQTDQVVCIVETEVGASILVVPHVRILSSE